MNKLYIIPFIPHNRRAGTMVNNPIMLVRFWPIAKVLKFFSDLTIVSYKVPIEKTGFNNARIIIKFAYMFESNNKIDNSCLNSIIKLVKTKLEVLKTAKLKM